MFAIRKSFDFSASHVLGGLPADHPCSRMHGHNYRVTVELAAADTDAVGFVLDYRRMDVFKRWLDDNLDHRHLNDVLEVNPSAEWLARYLWAMFAALLAGSLNDNGVLIEAVAVAETPKTWAEYRP